MCACVCLKNVVWKNRLKQKIQRGTVGLENQCSDFPTILILPHSTIAGENAQKKKKQVIDLIIDLL